MKEKLHNLDIDRLRNKFLSVFPTLSNSILVEFDRKNRIFKVTLKKYIEGETVDNIKMLECYDTSVSKIFPEFYLGKEEYNDKAYTLWYAVYPHI